MSESTAIVRSNGEAVAGAKVYRLDQLDDLDADVREGRIERVRFVRAADLYHGIWEGDIDIAAWLARSAVIEFEDGPAPDIRSVYESWRRWNAARRRRQAIAGIVFSAIALAACYLLYATMSGR